MNLRPPSIQPLRPSVSARLLRRSLAAVACTAALTASAQLLSLEVRTGNGIPPDYGDAPDVVIQHTTTTPDTAFASWNYDNVTTSASLFADYGVFRFETLMSANPGSTAMAPVGQTYAMFRDQITIMPPTPDLMGKGAYLDFSLYVHGVLAEITSVQIPNARLWINVTRVESNGDLAYPYPFFQSEAYSTQGATATIIVDETLDYHMNFRFGQAFNLQVEIRATSNMAYPSVNHSGIAQVNFGGSGQGVVWNGIQDVIYDGLPVTGYTITSASGTDWMVSAVAPVPEPATWAAIAGALALGVGVARKLGGRRPRRGA